MALSLWDHEQRLRDLELALHAVMEILLPDNSRNATLAAAAQRLRSRGHDGAAALLLALATRSYAR